MLVPMNVEMRRHIVGMSRNHGMIAISSPPKERTRSDVSESQSLVVKTFVGLIYCSLLKPG